MRRAASLGAGLHVAAVLLLAQLCLPAAVAAAPDRDRVVALLAKHHVPGASIALIEGGKVAWALGYGVKEVGKTEPVTSATLFQAASISKPVAAFAAMRLVGLGKLRLDDDVNDKLSSWRVPPNAFTRQQPVTLRLLLSHRAGVIVPGFPGYAASVQVPTPPPGARAASRLPTRLRSSWTCRRRGPSATRAAASASSSSC